MLQPDALPRPASFDQRIARRGCRNCIAWSAGRCRDNPGGIATEAHDWCTAWRWETNTRVGWDSAFAGLELDDSFVRPTLDETARTKPALSWMTRETRPALDYKPKATTTQIHLRTVFDTMKIFHMKGVCDCKFTMTEDQVKAIGPLDCPMCDKHFMPAYLHKIEVKRDRR